MSAFGDHLITSGCYDITPEQEREIWAREECARRGIDPDEICADGGVEAWMVVAQQVMPTCPSNCYFPGDCDGSCTHPEDLVMSENTDRNGSGKTLWAVSIEGPDDLLPTANYLDAVRVANAFNAWWQLQKIHSPLTENDPRMWASPVEYLGSAENHAAWVDEPSPDYAAFFVAASHNPTSQEREPSA